MAVVHIQETPQGAVEVLLDGETEIHTEIVIGVGQTRARAIHDALGTLEDATRDLTRRLRQSVKPTYEGA